MRRPLSSVLRLTVLLPLVACGGGDGTGPSQNEDPDDVVVIAITPTTVSLVVGESETLRATGTTVGGRLVTTGFSWSSQDDAVATVTSSGEVTAVAPGTTAVEVRSGSVLGVAVVVVTTEDGALAAPSGLTGTVQGSSVVLSWTDNSTGEEGFEIQRSDPSTAFAPVGFAEADGTSFTDFTAVGDGPFAYRVRAVSTSGFSSFSEEVEVQAPEPDPDPFRAAVGRVLDVYTDLMPASDTPADGRDLAGELEVVAAALVNDPDVVNVVVEPSTATAQVALRDGQTILLINNKLPQQADISPGPALHQALNAGLEGPQRSVPSSKRFGFVSIGGGASVATDLARIVPEAGYQVVSLGGGIEDFRSYKNLGGLYLDTHGAAYREISAIDTNALDEAVGVSYGATKYGVVTDTRVLVGDLNLYRDELLAGDIVVSITTDFLGVTDAKFAVTESFIAKHWQFDDAVTILHTCFGGSGPFTGSGSCFGSCATSSSEFYDATPIRNAMISAGADVILGFDNFVWPTTSRPSMEYYLDRLLGANQVAPSADPERRAFDVASVRAAMAGQGLLVHQKGGRAVNATLTTGGPESRIAGAPTIESIVVVDDAAQSRGQIELLGVFSQDEGQLTVAGLAADITSWTETRIEALTPFAGGGAGATGDVIVESPGGLKSNEVPLTEWSGTLTFELEPGEGTLAATLEVDLRFRADVHMPRLSVEGDPLPIPADTYISPESKARIVGSGTFTDENGTVQFFGTDEARILNRAEVDQKPGGTPVSPERFFGGQVTFDTGAQTARLCFAGAGPVRVRQIDENGTVERVEPLLGTLFPPLYDSLDGLMGCLELSMNSSYTIPSGRRTFNEGEATFTLEWTNFTATNPPTGDTKS